MIVFKNSKFGGYVLFQHGQKEEEREINAADKLICASIANHYISVVSSVLFRKYDCVRAQFERTITEN
jgi:hypothetical protein